MARSTYKQSAALPWRIHKGKLQFLLVTSTNSKRWVLPKGMVERGLSAAESAAMEAFEEAGLVGKISTKPAGRYNYLKWGATCDVRVYALKVKDRLDRFPESHFRQREWMSPASAAALVREPKLRKTILRMGKRLRAKYKKKLK